MATPQINQNLSVHDWLALPSEVRAGLISIFDIKRTGTGHIDYTGQGPIVTSDGHTYEDLKAINIKSMQAYTGSKLTDFTKLFTKVLEKLNEPIQKETK